MEKFLYNLNSIQPSQLYISKEKLNTVLQWFDPHRDDYDPLPVKELHGTLVFTDGHTRAFALANAGVTHCNVYKDPDDLDWHLYEHCVEWCRNEGIYSVYDLAARVIDAPQYQILWHDRCTALHREHGYID